MLVSMKCPSCAADLQIDDAREFMFCQYCGTKIANLAEKVEISGKVTVDNSAIINNLLHRGYEFEQSEKIEEALRYYNQVLDLQYDNRSAREGIARCNMIITDANVFISFKTTDNNHILQTSINDKLITKYRNGTICSFQLSVGKHIIKFKSGGLRYSREIIIKDRNTKLKVVFSQGRKNTIDIINI